MIQSRLSPILHQRQSSIIIYQCMLTSRIGELQTLHLQHFLYYNLSNSRLV